LLAYVALRPSVPSGWFNLGVLNADLDEPDEAARCFAIFHALAPEDPDGTVNLGRSLIEAEHLEFASDVLASAYRSNPCDLSLLESLRELSQRLADTYPTDSESSRRLLLSLDEQISSLE
jgi:Flp pilus assembly protein TadD